MASLATSAERLFIDGLHLVFSHLQSSEVACAIQTCRAWHHAATSQACLGWTLTMRMPPSFGDEVKWEESPLCRHPTRLDIDGWFDDERVGMVLRAMPSVTHIEISDTSDVTFEFLREVPQRLRQLDVRQCDPVTMMSFAAELEHAPALEHFTMEKCEMTETDRGRPFDIGGPLRDVSKAIRAALLREGRRRTCREIVPLFVDYDSCGISYRPSQYYSAVDGELEFIMPVESPTTPPTDATNRRPLGSG